MSKFVRKPAGAYALLAMIVVSVAATAVVLIDFGAEDSAIATAGPNHREFTLVAVDAELEIAPGEVVKTWTFNGTMPGPPLRFTEGDNVTVTFVNKSPLVHTVHFHGNHDEKNDGVMPQILPGENYTYNFIAEPAGAFMYHCHAYPTSLHIRMGMYGSIIVDPKDPELLKPAKEFALVLSEFDPENQDNFVAKYYPVNGYANQYMGENALEIEQNELARFYVINIGTTIPYSFHLHSTIFKTYYSGLPSNSAVDAQTIEIGPGNAAIVEASWKYPGTYMFHSHGFLEERGNMGEIHVYPERADEPTTNGSMIEWQYELQKQLQKPELIDYGNLSSSQVRPINHTGHESARVAILEGAWDQNQPKFYEPTDVSIGKGESIIWKNEDNVVHTVTSKEQGGFDSSILAAEQEWQHEFVEAGVYEYYCIVHPWMEGTVTVQ